MLQFLWDNIKHTLKNQRALSVLLILVQLFSVVIIVFSYGVINHYNFKVSERESTTLVYNFNMPFGDDGYPAITANMDDVDKFLKKALPEIEDKLDYFFVLGLTDDFTIQCSSGYKAGKFTLSTQLQKRIGVKTGEKFTADQMNSGEKLIIASEARIDSEGYVTINGEKYKAVGAMDASFAMNMVFLPYKAIPDETDVYHISFICKLPLWEGEYNSIVGMIREVFGDSFKIPEFEGVINESSNRVYRDIMVVTGFLIVVCTVNYCIMYRYMLEKRRREFAITRICGCTKYKAGLVYMIELMATSTMTLVAGMAMYHYWILPRAKEHFIYIGLYYSGFVYKVIAGIYIGVLSLMYLFLVCRFVRKTPVALIREV